MPHKLTMNKAKIFKFSSPCPEFSLQATNIYSENNNTKFD